MPIPTPAVVTVSTPWLRPTVASSVAYLNGLPWTNPNNILLDNILGANTTLAANQQSRLLVGYMTGVGLPTGAVIKGFTFKFKARVDNGTPLYGLFTPYLYLVGRGALGNKGAINSGSDAWSQQTAGGVADLWGLGTPLYGAVPTVEQINSGNFGIAVVAKQEGASNVSSVTDYQLQITYDEPAVSTQGTPALVLCDF